MLRIVHVAGTDSRKDGGVNNVIKNLTDQSLINIKCSIQCVYGYGPDGYLKGMPKLVRKFDLLISPWLLKIRLRHILKKQRIDIVHVHGADAAYDVARNRRWLKRCGVHCIARLPGTDWDVFNELKKELAAGAIRWKLQTVFHYLYFGLSWRKEKYAYAQMDHLNAVSRGVQQKVLAAYGLAATLTPNGFSPSRQLDDATYTRENLGIPRQARVLLFVGVSSWIKGYAYFSAVKKLLPETWAVVVGLSCADEHNVVNIPYVSHEKIGQLYRLSDIYVHTAVTEAFGLVYLEAMHYGLPIVTFKTDGALDLIVDGDNGFLVESRDIRTMTEKIRLLLGDNRLRQKFVQQGYSVAKKYTFKKTAFQNLIEYNKTMKQQKVLCIPHVIRNGVRSRTEEMARALVLRDHQVFMLAWGARPDRKYGFSLSNIWYAVHELLCLPKTVCADGIRYVYLPRLVFPLGLATVFNSYMVNRFIRTQGIQKVINAAFLYYRIDNEKLSYVYDLVDDHVAYTANNGRLGARRLAKRIDVYINEEIAKADRVVYVSAPLRDKYGSRSKSKIIPNGAFIDQYAFDQAALKQKHALSGKYVYGMIGNHGEWSGIKTIIEFFKKHFRQSNNVRLVIAGPVYDPRLVRHLPKSIVYLGVIPKAQINEIYGLIDCGIQAADDDEFRKMTAPLKVIEYSAARKIVWALQAENLNAYKLPNLVVSARDPQSMLKTLNACRLLRWNPRWDLQLRQYDWRQLVTKF